MFGRKGLSGNRAAAAPQAYQGPPASADRVRRDFGRDETVFERELFQGEMGDFLRKHGYAPDDPINMLASQEPVAAQLAEGQADLRATLGRLNAVGTCRIGAFQLLPPILWHGRYGGFLLKRLDLSPYRPWNTIFLPLDEEGAMVLGLPVLPERSDPGVPEGLEVMVEIIADIFRGEPSPEAEACKSLFASVRSNFPYLFPADHADFSGNVREARSNVRALAFMQASSEIVDKDVVIKSQQTFLAHPEIQLTN